MITKSKVVIVAMAVMLIGATAIASEDAFAKKGEIARAKQPLNPMNVAMVYS
jgi:hypothetical protein